MADKSKLGRIYEFDWLVERGKITEFVDALTGRTSPSLRERSPEGPEECHDAVAPPTFTTVPIIWSGVLFKAFEDLAIPLSRIMHAEQSYEYPGEIHAGDLLHGTMEIKSITEREGRAGPMEFVLFETVFTNQHGRTVVREQMLIVEIKKP